MIYAREEIFPHGINKMTELSQPTRIVEPKTNHPKHTQSTSPFSRKNSFPRKQKAEEIFYSVFFFFPPSFFLGTRTSQ